MKIRVQLEDIQGKKDLGKRFEKIFSGLDKYLHNFNESMTRTRIRVSKRSRWGYKMKFEMNLPGKRVYVEEKGKDLITLSYKVKTKAERQLRKYVEKLRKRD